MTTLLEVFRDPRFSLSVGAIIGACIARFFPWAVVPEVVLWFVYAMAVWTMKIARPE